MAYIRKMSTAEKIHNAYIVAERNYDIAKRAMNGESYENIGRAYQISRERVSDILSRMAIHKGEIRSMP